MKTTKAIILALTIGASSSLTIAQDSPQPRPPGGDIPRGDQPRGDRPRGDGQPGGEGRPGQGRPGQPDGQFFRPIPNPLFGALDINKDGVIDADELAKASESLKPLDKNGDGKIAAEELRQMPIRPFNQPPKDGAEPRPQGRPDGAPVRPKAPSDEPRGERPQRPDQAR